MKIVFEMISNSDKNNPTIPPVQTTTVVIKLVRKLIRFLFDSLIYSIIIILYKFIKLCQIF